MARLGQTYLSRDSKFSTVLELENLSEKCDGVTWLNWLPFALGDKIFMEETLHIFAYNRK